ncbi:unnamed protein product, partial [Larinioides sclopetarius]
MILLCWLNLTVHVQVRILQRRLHFRVRDLKTCKEHKGSTV